MLFGFCLPLDRSRNGFSTLRLQADLIFEVLKAYLKRAPSLKGAALVKLSQLKIQVHPWPALSNHTRIAAMLDKVKENKV